MRRAQMRRDVVALATHKLPGSGFKFLGAVHVLDSDQGGVNQSIFAGHTKGHEDE